MRIRSHQLRRTLLVMSSNVRSGLFVGMALALAILVGAALLFWAVEQEENPDVPNLAAGFLWVTRTLLQGEPPFEPSTIIGHILFYVVVITGVGIIALATGAIASKLIELIMRKDAGMGEATYRDHVIICGWSPQGEEILRELHSEEVLDPPPVVIVAPLEQKPTEDDLVTFIRGEPTNAEDLRRAGLERARTAIILADHSSPGATADERDGKTLLAALAVESLNPKIHTCVEVIRAENRPHFERTRADELVVSAELTGALLATAAQNHGISRVVTDLTTHGRGHEFYPLEAPSWLDGASFVDAGAELKRRTEALLIGVRDDQDSWDLNPAADRPIRAGDDLLVISSQDPSEVLSA